MTAHEDYLGRVRAMVWSASEHLPDDALGQARSLVEHGEPAEGVAYVAWTIVGTGTHVPRTLIEEIRSLADGGPGGDGDLPADLDDFVVAP